MFNPAPPFKTIRYVEITGLMLTTIR